ncbi:DUF3135 domain-containing protein [Sulfuricella sp.]|uniref:DUF3135 domain-containing protein n=1 Tax=Sulfuricella sp. TaxID=2099377 RepID=UPI002BB83D66|nr:DUF3135 domain-containing protein [Sulfuricella sp.]HUX63342.1 DUF3135 domain-containing protein [Sulfuricella sp.]
MSYPQLEHFDFDEWMALAHSDPDAFEKQRKRVIDAAIAQAPQHMQTRLHALQWRIDMERSRASNPLSACIRLSNMMWKMVYGNKGLMAAIGDLTDSTHLPRHSADVIAFVRR